MSLDRKTGIHVAPDQPREDYSEFLTGEPLADRKRVAMLLETIAEVNSSVEVATVMQNVARKSIGVSGAERAIVMLFDEQNVLRIVLATDTKGTALGTNVQYSHSVAMRVAREGKGICLIDTANQGDISLGQSILDLKLLTVMCVPLRVKDRMIGLLYVDSKASSKEFRERDLTLFKALAGQVAVAIDNARLLQHYVEKQRMQEELAVAQKIQQSLLPRGGLQAPGLDVFGMSVPCDETSGDYFDYIRRSGGRLAFVVGDVSGHGIGAALVMSTARALLRAFTSDDSGPAAVITRLNKFLSDDVETGRFMTMFYGEVNLRERTLTYVRAGHNEPLVYRRASDTFEELGEGGIALAMMDDFDFEAAGPVVLEKGDILFMFTDGIVEAMNAAREPFGLGRIHEILRAHRDLPAKDLVERVRAAVRQHTGTDVREDDLTIVVAKITG
ncbi:MAG: SpoIIE family protein phosphatase [Planctomycetes bacterium]|nr:SpoIIE family protein phosphatase [Planctomycetota bacterium]